eukprot:s2181_g7.t2
MPVELNAHWRKVPEGTGTGLFDSVPAIRGNSKRARECYSLSLDLVECFPLEQERAELRGDGRGERKAKGKSGKVTTLAYLPAAGSFILAGSESGCELWQLTKSRERRINTSRLRGLEYHLQLNLIKQVTTEPVHRIVVAAEGRVVIAELKTVLVLDHELNLMASCNQPFVCSAYLGTVSSSQAIRWKAQLLTGQSPKAMHAFPIASTSGGAVQLWNIQAFESQLGDPSGDGLFTRLEHTFNGHTRSVEMVCFYDRDEHDVQQRFAVSCALDLRLQVWSMENFVCVYTLYFGLADSKAHIFPISLHHFALSYTIGGGSNGVPSQACDGAAGASVAMMRFNVAWELLELRGGILLPFFFSVEAAMAEEDKSTSAWYKVPTWDGSPASWRAFQREMNWWLSSLDVESTKKFNLAARWLLRQGGVVRQRGEEFAPEDLVYQKEVRAKDTDGVEIVVTKEDPFAGINKLLKALEGINGRSALDRKGELRNQFYLTLRRSPGERPADFLSRFRVLTAEMRSEGIDLPTGELGWFLREKLGLDPLRKQLLETALQGREKFEDVEAEALRLFKDLHASDPLFRKLGQEARGRGRGFAGSSSSSGASSLRSSGGSTWQSRTGSSIGTASAGAKAAGQGGPFQNRRPFFGNFRAKQAYAAEAEDETAEDTYEPEEEELLADEPAEPPNLDEVLEIEAEALAAELEQAENEGVDPSMLEQVEGCVETAAEALITMRDAKTRLQEVRRDRGYGRAGGNSGGQGQRPPPPFKKRGVCHDCGLPGHWAGDAGCARPGAGLAKPKPRKDAGRGGGSPSSSPPSGSPHRRVQVVETFAAEAGQEQDHEDQKVNETAVASTLEQALEMTCPQEVLAGAMASDKRNAGALDSACNRTVCGRMWLESYIADLRASPCWKALQPLLATEAEKETFKFGNDGTKASMERYRIPVTIGDTVVCVWTSVVEVRSLGLLLGRDFLEAIGGVISFTRRALRADHLDCRRIPLRQLSAGHFYLELLPKDFSEDLGRRWTRQGADGVLEVQVSCAEWLLLEIQFVVSARCLMLAGAAEGRAGRVWNRFRRMCLRLLERNVWHFAGLLLWLLQRPLLRYVPLPYSNTRSLEEWKEQAEAMVKQGAWPRRHYRTALMQGKFEDVGLMKDAGYLRDRLGIKLAFLEDPMLPGMLAARYTKGVKAAIQSQMVDRLRKEAAEKKAKGEELMAARSLLGPKGGLPSLKQDLLRLAVLLHVEVQSNDTVDKLKARLRPMVDTLRGIPLSGTAVTTTAATSSRTPLPVASGSTAAPQGLGPGAQGDSPGQAQPRALPELRSAGPMATNSVDNAALLSQVQGMLEAPDQRMTTMLAQAMQHVMTMTQQPADGEPPLSPPDSDMGFQTVDQDL